MEKSTATAWEALATFRHDEQRKEFDDPAYRRRAAMGITARDRRRGYMKLTFKLSDETLGAYFASEIHYKAAIDALEAVIKGPKPSRLFATHEETISEYFSLLNNMAVVVRRQGSPAKLKEAERLYKQVLEAEDPGASLSCKQSVLQNLITLYGTWEKPAMVRKTEEVLKQINAEIERSGENPEAESKADVWSDFSAMQNSMRELRGTQCGHCRKAAWKVEKGLVLREDKKHIFTETKFKKCARVRNGRREHARI